LKLINLKPCDGSTGTKIKLINQSFDVNDECEFRPKSCAEVQPYQIAKVQLKVIQDTVTIVDVQHNLCSKEKAPESVITNLALLGIPKFCPKKSSVYCYDGSIIPVSAVSRKIVSFVVKGRTSSTIRVNFTFDHGEYSCFDMEQKFVPKKNGRA
jgi:hypothetical protein